MAELCLLQDDVPSFPDEQAFAMMRQQIGGPIETVFSSISERPIAAASLGQVWTRVCVFFWGGEGSGSEQVFAMVQQQIGGPINMVFSQHQRGALCRWGRVWTSVAEKCHSTSVPST
eukprot:74400-Chlamydomonas_euryale.AAC.2